MRHFIYIFVFAVVSALNYCSDGFADSRHQHSTFELESVSNDYKTFRNDHVYENEPDSAAMLTKTTSQINFSCCDQKPYPKSNITNIRFYSDKKESTKYKLFKSRFKLVSAFKRVRGYYIYFLRKIII